MNTTTDNLSRAFYFGLPVEVVYRMETCSLVLFSGQGLIVDSDDLTTEQRTQCGSTGLRSPQRPSAEPVRLPQAKAARTD